MSTSPNTVLVVGASRGIGFEFVRQCRADGDRVFATARDRAGIDRIAQTGATAIEVDVTIEPSVAALGERLQAERIDLALYVAGAYSRHGATRAPSEDEFDRVMHTNVLGAMRVIARVAPRVEAAGGRLAFITSGMGQIGTVGSSFGLVYRASKAALNMVVAASRHDFPRAVFVAISPGWVRTDMGGPDAPLSVEQSVAAMRRALAGLSGEHNGAFLDHDGTRFKSW